MKKFLFSILAFSLCLSLFSQKDTTTVAVNNYNNFTLTDNISEVNIFPVPVKDGQFTIRSEKEITAVRITNIIGQEIFKAVYNNPEKEIRITLDNAGRGIYIILVTFSNNTRIVKKISSEGNSF